jgi:GNAT acetyltransferase-like protein/ROK family protein
VSDPSAPATALGVDIGGTAIKSAPVDVVSGHLLRARQRVLTPNPSTPKTIGEVVGGLARRFDWHGAVGCAFPAIVKHGVTLSAANVDASWIETDADAVLTEATGCPVTVINDGDAAGVAEMRWGHGYATEAARAAIADGFSRLDLEEIVSFTSRTNVRSQAVMRRLGMTHDAADDFDHPRVAVGSPLRPHVLYRRRRS